VSTISLLDIRARVKRIPQVNGIGMGFSAGGVRYPALRSWWQDNMPDCWYHGGMSGLVVSES